MKNVNRPFPHLVFLAPVLLSFVTLSGCSRSDQFVREKQYYKTDSVYEEGAKKEAFDQADKLGSPKKKLFVMPFWNVTPFEKRPGAAGGPDDLGVFVAEELARAIQVGAKAIVPDNLRSGAQSQDYFVGDKVRVGSLVREGRRLGVSLVVMGRIRKITYRQKADELGLLQKRNSMAVVDLEMRMFDVTQGKELLLDEKAGDSSTSRLNLFGGEDENQDSDDSRVDLVHQALRNAVARLARAVGQVMEKVAWEGRVAKISGGHVYINAGRRSGIALGDILKVMSSGDDVYDPVSGAFMGKSQGAVKGTLEVVDYLGPDGSLTRIHSGGGFLENDIVQLY